MNVGALKVRLRLPENQSLKGKRQAVRSIIARVRNNFNVSIAEVEDQELWQVATLGVVFISNDTRYNNEVLSKVVNLIESIRGDVELLDYEIELLNSL